MFVLRHFGVSVFLKMPESKIHLNTVQPKNNAGARTSFCVRKQKFFLRLIVGHLSLSSGNRKNFFAIA